MSGDEQDPSAQRQGEDVGTVAEEAAKLLTAFTDWAREHGADLGDGAAGLAGHAARAAHDLDEHLATGAEECAYCPICRGVQALRRTSPDVRTHLAAAASSLVQAAAGLLATAVPEERRSDGGVEHIDLDDPDDPDDLDDPADEPDLGKTGPEEEDS